MGGFNINIINEDHQATSDLINLMNSNSLYPVI